MFLNNYLYYIFLNFTGFICYQIGFILLTCIVDILGGSLVAKSCLTLATPWTVAHQAPLSMGFSRLENWSGFHFLLQGIFLTQELNSDLLDCRQIIYQLSYEGSPEVSSGS